MEGEACYSCLVPSHCVFGWGFGEVKFSDVDVFIGADSSTFGKLFFETEAFLLQSADFFL